MGEFFEGRFRTVTEEAVRKILEAIGPEDADRDGLQDTPKRVARALFEMMAGYNTDPATVLQRRFQSHYDGIALLKGIAFSSLCEHHMLPFTGVCHVAYIPQDYVVGISKLARLVEAYARRLQIQERMTMQIAECIQQELNPVGVAVVIEARHMCMQCRGVKQSETVFETSCLLGAFRLRPEARNEVLTLLRS